MDNDGNRTNKHRRKINKKNIRRYRNGGGVNIRTKRIPKFKPSPAQFCGYEGSFQIWYDTNEYGFYTGDWYSNGVSCETNQDCPSPDPGYVATGCFQGSGVGDNWPSIEGCCVEYME